jgi:hypothetical protein
MTISRLKLLASTAGTIAALICSPAAAQDASAKACDPYKDYSCLDTYLGSGVVERFFNYYRLEWGESGAPTDPNVLPSERDGWPQTPESIPPMAYSEFPTGALTSIGVSRPNGTDSPLMAAIANTGFGKWLADSNTQIYGWVNPGFNFSTNKSKFGNAPVAYTINPDTAELDQAVLYVERVPDTVQTDHIDWGFRLSGIYGQNYRYTNSYGLASWQFNGKNNWEGYDFPMAYVDIWIPQVFQGLEVRVGRFISIPDIEAQLAPNNIMYTHSLTYAVDNYTNTGVVLSWQLTKNLLLQTGIVDGTETPIWHNGLKIANQYVQSGSNAAGFGPGVDPLFPNATMLKDPGNQPSGVLCLRYESDDGKDVLYPCLNGINKGNWGYNNLQWHGFTYYHKFDDHWHVDFETYWMSENDVPNLNNPQAVALFNNGGTPFSPQTVNFNSPNLAYCDNAAKLACSVNAYGVVSYINYSPDKLDNISLRPEFYDDPNGWRTGTGKPTKYADLTLSWQHWLSPQIEFRPEVSYWRSYRTPAFNGDVYAGIAGNKFDMTEFASDVIIHF